MNRLRYTIALLLVLCFILLIYNRLTPTCAQSSQVSLNSMTLFKMMQTTLQLIRNNYVDEVDLRKVMEGGIQGMLDALDPHCNYIPPESNLSFQEEYSGEFYGIGINYDIIQGLITVISPIEGSPAYHAGLKAGDKITRIDHISAINITSDEIRRKLRGSKGSQVILSIRRSGEEKEIDFTLVRDKIHVASVPYSYMLDDSSGYIRVITFSETTSHELDSAIQNLIQKGMKQLVLDLRSNSGGLLNEAVEMAKSFLGNEQEIVTTKGRDTESIETFKSDLKAKQSILPLIVMISHQTASASEIVSGAIQDWDRGLIVGSRSFGKGLVQRQFPLESNASILLTIARYYTPSGRLIQRDYSKGNIQYYLEDTEDTDSVYSDSTQTIYYTKQKRKVYGGGGIAPDIRISWAIPNKLIESIAFHPQRILIEYADQFCHAHPELKNDYDYFLKHYDLSDSEMVNLEAFFKTSKIYISHEEILKNRAEIQRHVKRAIATYFWDLNRADQVYHYHHPDILETLKYFTRSRQLCQNYLSL